MMGIKPQKGIKHHTWPGKGRWEGQQKIMPSEVVSKAEHDVPVGCGHSVSGAGWSRPWLRSIIKSGVRL